MVHLYKELQPSDSFDIMLNSPLSSQHRQLLTLFYQPLTGAEPISLYFTLLAEVENPFHTELSHYYLMNVLGTPIGKIFQSRIALEAIGLLRTYRKQTEDSRSFIYECMPPLSAEQFFDDPLLSMFLFSKIGEQAYRKLRQRFNASTKDMTSYVEVSRSFTDVYTPVQNRLPIEFQEQQNHTAQQTKAYPFYYEQFDFQLLQAGLSEQLVPVSTLTLNMKEEIAKIAFLYNLTPLDMQKIVILAIDDNLKLSPERLRKAAADFYKLTVSKEPPQLTKIVNVQQVDDVEEIQNATKEQELQHYLETTPPIQLLRDINNGKEPLPVSVQLAENLILHHGMPMGVVNALLEYVMLTTDMNLPPKYVEKIADHWMRKNVQTAREAIELARHEHDKYKAWKTTSQTQGASTNVANTQNARPTKAKSWHKPNKNEEKVPDWFYKRNQPQSQQAEETKDIDFEKERQKILEKLGRKDG